MEEKDINSEQGVKLESNHKSEPESKPEPESILNPELISELEIKPAPGRHEDGSYMHGFNTVHLRPNTWLIERRRALGLTQKQVAERAGIKQQQYQQFESGKRNLMISSFKITCGVLEALGYSFEAFYHHEYVLGEEVYMDKEGVQRFERNGEDVEREYEGDSDDNNDITPVSDPAP